MTYFAGYFAKKIVSAMKNCLKCEQLLTKTGFLEENTMLLFFKEYDNCERLNYPSKDLYNAIKQFSNIFFANIESFLQKIIISRLLYSQLDTINMELLNVHSEHNVKNFIIRIMLYYYTQKIIQRFVLNSKIFFIFCLLNK